MVYNCDYLKKRKGVKLINDSGDELKEAQAPAHP